MTFLFLANSTLTSSNPFLSLFFVRLNITGVHIFYFFQLPPLCAETLCSNFSFSSSHVLSTSHDKLQLHFYFSFYSKLSSPFPKCSVVVGICRDFLSLTSLSSFFFLFGVGELLLPTTMTNPFATAGSLQNSLQAYWLTSFFVWRKCCHSLFHPFSMLSKFHLFSLTCSL